MFTKALVVLFPFMVATACSSDTPAVANTSTATGGTSGGADASPELPDCHGEWPSAWVAKENQLTELVNAARAKGGTCNGVTYPGVPPVNADPQLTVISRCFARQQLLAERDALIGSAADSAIRDQVTSTNFKGTLTGYAGDMTQSTAEEVLAGFLATPYQCPALFNPDTNVGAIGYVEDPSKFVKQRWAGVMAIEGDAGTAINTTAINLSTNDLPDWVRSPGPGRKVERAGVNLAGAEFGTSVPGVYDKDYTYPKTNEVDYFVARGMNAFRIPFLWERLQPTLNGDLDSAELARLSEVVNYATNAGSTVILDPHNYARRNGSLIGSDALPDTAFADFWSKLASVFKGNARVAFGLMNEPHDLGAGGTQRWLTSVNTTIAAIRATTATNLLLVPGDFWTGASTFTQNANAIIMQNVVDSAKNFAFEVHQYLDADSSGSGIECVSRTIGATRVSAFTTWARSGGFRAYLGEFGAPPTETCLYAVDGLLEYLGSNNDVWLGWTWWSAGPWWGDYPLSIEPRSDGTEAPQMVLLDRYLTKP